MHSAHLDIMVNGLFGVVEGVIVDAAPVAVREVLWRRDGAHDGASVVYLRHHDIFLQVQFKG